MIQSRVRWPPSVPQFDPASIADLIIDTPINTFVVDEPGIGLVADYVEFFERLTPGFEGPDEAVIVSSALRALLEEMRDRLEGEPPRPSG